MFGKEDFANLIIWLVSFILPTGTCRALLVYFRKSGYLNLCFSMVIFILGIVTKALYDKRHEGK